jgi:hypothetical protein
MFEVEKGDKLMIQGQGRYWIYNQEREIIMCSGKEINLLSPITLEIKEPGYAKVEEKSTARLLRTQP